MACELLKDFNNSPLKVSEELNIPLKTFEKWAYLYKRNDKIFDEDYKSPQDEIKNLQSVIKKQNETIDILKKACAFFAQKEKAPFM